jgi:type I restriction enzyme M protein
MNHATHNAIVSFIWNIADDVLRDVYVRGKYRDVILPMTVLRRLDCLLEPTKDAVLERDKFLEKSKIKDKSALTKVTGYKFWNTSKFTMRRLLDEPKLVRANFDNYLSGFSENVQEIIVKFKLANQLQTLHESNRLYPLIQKFVSKDINLSPDAVVNDKGEVIHEGLSNLGMGYVFEELIRKFNEENNEEAGEHFTPRDIIKLMTHLLFEPIKDQIQSGTYLVYDDACGSGGMLTEAETFLKQLAEAAGKKVAIELYGQEVNPETYAICQSDMLIKGRDPANIKYASTLAQDGFPGMEFDFMLANPPYGKSWKVDQDALLDGNKKYVTDSRFVVNHPGLPPGETLSLIPRVSDGQLLFQVNMLAKMKRRTKLGSRIAIVHNGSALFTGDAGQGESNIRRWIIENDWLEAIIGVPENMFYNTGIATYIWVLTNRKPEHRKGRVQLIDATNLYRKLRKNLGQKNCEFADEHIDHIAELFLNFAETSESKIFDNADFGYAKIVVERPLRLTTHVTSERLAQFKQENDACLHPLADALADLLGDAPHKDFNIVREKFEKRLKRDGVKAKKIDLTALWNVFTEKDETAKPVRIKTSEVSKNFGSLAGVYEPDADLRDTENVPLKESVDDYFAREVLPYAADAWIDREKTQVGYEISFTKYFYKYQPLRPLEEIASDILALERETEGLLQRIIDGEGRQ